MYFEWLIEELRARERTIASVRLNGGDLVTHVDRLFAYRVESRQECVGCRKLSVECTVECVWRVSTGLYEVDDATVTELFLRSCSVQSKFDYCTRCASDQAHRVQRRLLSLPNIMVVVIDRPRSMQVRAEEQLVLALFGLENLELLGVCYERGSRHSSCACRSVDGDFLVSEAWGRATMYWQDCGRYIAKQSYAGSLSAARWCSCLRWC